MLVDCISPQCVGVITKEKKVTSRERIVGRKYARKERKEGMRLEKEKAG